MIYKEFVFYVYSNYAHTLSTANTIEIKFCEYSSWYHSIERNFTYYTKTIMHLWRSDDL